MNELHAIQAKTSSLCSEACEFAGTPLHRVMQELFESLLNERRVALVDASPAEVPALQAEAKLLKKLRTGITDAGASIRNI